MTLPIAADVAINALRDRSVPTVFALCPAAKERFFAVAFAWIRKWIPTTVAGAETFVVQIRLAWTTSARVLVVPVRPSATAYVPTWIPTIPIVVRVAPFVPPDKIVPTEAVWSAIAPPQTAMGMDGWSPMGTVVTNQELAGSNPKKSTQEPSRCLAMASMITAMVWSIFSISRMQRLAIVV